MNENRRRQDAMYAKLALSAHAAPPAGECPSPEDLAAFSQGLLKGEPRDAVLHHLACCDACHQELMDVTSLLALSQDEVPTEARTPLAVVEALNKGAAWLKELKQRIVQGSPIAESEAGSLKESLMAVLLPGLPQPAEVMAQEAGPALLQCPWCGSVGAAPQNADAFTQDAAHGDEAPAEPVETWYRCDSCGGAFRR